MDFPLLSRGDPEHYSEKQQIGCAICHAPVVVPNSFIEISGGISDYSNVVDGQEVDLHIASHSAYDNGIGSKEFKQIPIIQNHDFGQYRIRFCSKRCLSKFFNSILSALPDDV